MIVILSHFHFNILFDIKIYKSNYIKNKEKQKKRRIIFFISVPPQIHVPNQLVGVPRGNNVTIECKVEAYPKVSNTTIY